MPIRPTMPHQMIQWVLQLPREITIVLLLAIPVMFHATTARAADGQSVEKLETVVSTAPTWKATESSALFDLSGTQIANGNAYAFGHVRVLSENVAVEKAVNPDWKIFLRAQYVSNFYELIARGKVYEERTAGLGDTALGAADVLVNDGPFRLLADGGLGLPTGSIDFANEYAPGARYKYFLQLGSGTVDGLAGLTSLYLMPSYQLGGRISSVLRSGLNHNGYRLGNQYRADAWADVPAGFGFTPRLVGYYRQKAPLEGADPTITRAASEFYFHDQIDWSVAAALKFEHAIYRQVAVNAEIGSPLWQGMQNFDAVVISTNYYGSVAVTGQF